MTEFLRDPVWQFIGALIALIATVITVLIFLAQRNRKSLSYEILSCIPVVSVSSEIEGKLKILFKGKAVTKVYLVIIKLSNLGNVPITSSDYEKPVRFKFHKGSKILTAEIAERSPKNLTVSFTFDETIVKLEPALLNSGDYISLQFLASGLDSSLPIDVDGRIAGVKDIVEKTENNLPNLGLLVVSGAITVIGFILSLYTPPSPGVISSQELFPGGLVFLLGQIIFSYALLFRMRLISKFMKFFGTS